MTQNKKRKRAVHQKAVDSGKSYASTLQSTQGSKEPIFEAIRAVKSLYDAVWDAFPYVWLHPDDLVLFLNQSASRVVSREEGDLPEWYHGRILGLNDQGLYHGVRLMVGRNDIGCGYIARGVFMVTQDRNGEGHMVFPLQLTPHRWRFGKELDP